MTNDFRRATGSPPSTYAADQARARKKLQGDVDPA